MSQHECKGCSEYSELSRRRFVGLATGVAASAVIPQWLPRVALAGSYVGGRDVLVSIFLRGGVDALTICVPFLEDNYYKLRPTLSVPPPDSGKKNKATALDNQFGFPPVMRPLTDVFESKDLLIVHACGMKHGNRSHFDAMKFMEVGREDPRASEFSGWLGRHLAQTGPTTDNAVLRAVGIGGGVPVTLLGGPKVLPTWDLASYGFGWDDPLNDYYLPMYEAAGDALRTQAKNTVRTIELLDTIDFESYQPASGAAYPSDFFGESLKSTAALIKAEIGVEAISIDLDGWDTHEKQGPFEGWMADLMTQLSEGLAAFHEDLAAGKGQPVTTMVMSEFGRNTHENGSAGTDHGAGGLMMAMGSAIKGGRVLTEWPGLERKNMFEEQDLQVTIDYRDIITEIIGKRLGNTDYRGLFPDPGYNPIEYGVAK